MGACLGVIGIMVWVLALGPCGGHGESSGPIVHLGLVTTRPLRLNFECSGCKCTLPAINAINAINPLNTNNATPPLSGINP